MSGLARSLARTAVAQQQASIKASNGLGPFQASPQYGLSLGGGPGLPRPDATFLTQMGPLAPMLPYPLDRPKPGETYPEPRIWEFPVGANLPTHPGDGKRVSFAQLRQYADLYDVARRAIELRKTELSSLTWDIVLDPDKIKDLGRDAYTEERAQLRQFWSQPDNNYFDLAAWLRAIMEDFLVIDAVSIYPVRARGKGWFGSGIAELRLIDSSTIRPVLDITGGTPRPPDVAYQQYLWGVPRTDLAAFAAQPDATSDTGELVGAYTSAELLYLKMNPRTFTPYGFSNTEHAMLTIVTALKRKEWMLSYFDEGSVPALFVSMPEKADWTPDQIERREQNLNEVIAASMGGKWKIKFLPPGATPNPLKPPVLSDDFDQLLMQTIAMCYDVTPSELGFMPKSGLGGKGLGDSMENLQQRKSLVPSARLIERTFDRINHRLLGAPRDLLFRFNELTPAEDQERQANIDKIHVSVGLKTIDEVRESNGDEAFGLPETKVPIIITATGPVALVEAIQRSQEPPAPPPGLAPAGGPPPDGGGQPRAGAQGSGTGAEGAPDAPGKAKGQEKPPVSKVAAAAKGTGLAERVYDALAEVYPARVLGWVKDAAWREEDAIPLADIDMARRPGGRDQKKVEGIAQAVQDGEAMDPVVLVDDGTDKFQIADGYHRTLGYKRAGKATIPAYVGSGLEPGGPWEEAMHAAKLNKALADEFRALGRFLATRQWRRGRPFVAQALTAEQVAAASASPEGYAEVGKALGVSAKVGEES